MPTRRHFLYTVSAAGVLGVVRLDAQGSDRGRKVFIHGVASGDPLADRVILWTRVEAPQGSTPDVAWEISSDERFRRIDARGTLATGAARDYTVKIDAQGLQPGRTYYYRFTARGERSPIGRTRTLPARGVRHLRLAIASCANLPFGYFNVYQRIAERADLDAVLHLGDYLYEYQNGRYGNGTAFGRIPDPDREIVTLDDYRHRHAQYKRDPDLQEAHRQHPFITVWDDHEFANNTWRDGAENHNPDRGEGEWAARRAAAAQAYLEWMPIREDLATRRPRIYRSFAFGDLADLIMLDTRLIDRDEQAPNRDAIAVIDDPKRGLLGRAQEEWLFDELRASARAQVTWQLLGQQVMFAPASVPGASSTSTDTWDGYRPARERVFDAIESNRLRNVVVLTGDVHSSWAYDLARDPSSGYNPVTGAGTAAIEIVTPAVTSSSGFGDANRAAERVKDLMEKRPHLKFVDGLYRGYVILDVTAERVQGDWFAVPTITEQTRDERFLKGYFSVAGDPHLQRAAVPAAASTSASAPAPGESAS
jgi:alkaline phosphatase D